MSNEVKILVVDDSTTVHKLMRKYLEPEGFTICDYAANGQEGVDKFQEHNPDITFLDITMPVMDGIAALREIKSINPEAVVVMLSAMGDEEIQEEARNIGVNLFLQKPFNKDKLKQAIETVLGR